ncbi:MAG: FAD-dependent oxidoreductase, partial [Chloroflexota bacterium]|nr:FAD-dependent oxidoreductase [Chloroflexota bacterium]
MRKGLLGVAVLGAASGGAAWAASRRRPLHQPGPGAARAVVLGAGFGGLSAAKALADGRGDLDLHVLLIDQHNYQLFTPILYQVATGGVGPDNIAHPVRHVSRAHGFQFRESTVQRIDLDDRCVYTDDGPVRYDFLVVALGSTTSFFGLADVEEHSLTLKTLGDGITIRNRILDAFERADVETDPDRRRALLTFIVVGGGYTGVELVSSIR